MKKIFIKTWGCQMNEHDSSIIINTLIKKNKYQLTTSSKNADILILNTCSVREKAQEKIFHQLGRWKKLKKNNPNIIIAVGGCVASQEGKSLLNRTKLIDIIFGTQTLHQLPHLIEQHLQYKKTIINVDFKGLEKYNNPVQTQTSQISSLVSIMEGCNKHCSFCIVPYTRGKEISRLSEDILYEILSLIKKGIKEIILLGQNVNAYLIKHSKNFCNFSQLLKKIIAIKELKRIRFITSNPINFSDDIINLYNESHKLTNFLHLPVQSGSDKILKNMKRGYTVSQYKKIIDKLKKIRPNIQISSDFIVGFPGETSVDFQKTIDLISEINFDMSFSFIYSPRPGTRSIKLIDNVSMQEKKERLYELQKKITNQTMSWSRKMLGTTQLVLVEGVSKKNIMHLSGKTENNRTVHFLGNPNLIGKIIKINITEVNYLNLKGKITS